MNSKHARKELIRTLQFAYSGELAAAHAYHGHWKSTRDKQEQNEIRKIELDELEHRRDLKCKLDELEAAPLRGRDWRAAIVGKVLGMLCRVSAWYLRMYGAGHLELLGIVEYENAARYASNAGYDKWVDDFLQMAELEWEHEKYFREKCEGHFMRHFLPIWKPPGLQSGIRLRFEELSQGPKRSLDFQSLADSL